MSGCLVEESDGSGGARGYIARLRTRGHRRASSAPVHCWSPPLYPSQGEEGEQGRRERGKMAARKMESKRSPPLVVPYLSPVVLRKEVETLITQDGSHVLEKEELVTSSPCIYWNLVWYFSRLQLPTYLPLLPLWSFTRHNRELKKQYVQMKVTLLWDKSFPNVPAPLYRVLLGRFPRAKQPTSPLLTKRDSESQLQSLVAHAQCGDLLHVLKCLLQDRQSQVSLAGEKNCSGVPFRNLYREVLFLKSLTQGGNIDVDWFDQEYQQAVQRLPREMSVLLAPDDHPPASRALYCRRNFSPLQVI